MKKPQMPAKIKKKVDRKRAITKNKKAAKKAGKGKAPPFKKK